MELCKRRIGGFWPPDGKTDLQFGIWDLGFGRGNTGNGRGGVGHFATGVFAELQLCNARREVGFLHNSPRWWRNGVAKAERGKRKADEETGRFGAQALGIVRHPLLHKGAELCEKTMKTPFSLQNSTGKIAEVVVAKWVTDFDGANCAKMSELRLQKEFGSGNSECGMTMGRRSAWSQTLIRLG